MKKIITTTIIILFSLSCFSQTQKKDTIIAITMSITDLRTFLNIMDASIDSKTRSKELLAIIQSHAAIVPERTDSTTQLKNKKSTK